MQVNKSLSNLFLYRSRIESYSILIYQFFFTTDRNRIWIKVHLYIWEVNPILKLSKPMAVILVCLINNDRDQGLNANEKRTKFFKSEKHTCNHSAMAVFTLYRNSVLDCHSVSLIQNEMNYTRKGGNIHRRLRKKQVSIECKYWKSLAKDVYINDYTARCETSVVYNLDMFM